jgi:hypothetical protein
MEPISPLSWLFSSMRPLLICIDLGKDVGKTFDFMFGLHGLRPLL